MSIQGILYFWWILISTNATIQVERTITDRLIATLRPFISTVADGIRSGLHIRNAIKAAASLHTEAANSFVIEPDPSHFGLKPELLFPHDNRIDRFIFSNNASGKRVFLNELCDEEVREVGDIILFLNGVLQKQDALRICPYPNMIQTLYEAGIFVEDSVKTNWSFRLNEIGITRLQHASFLLKTDKARIIVDPHFVSGYSCHLQQTSLMLAQNFSQTVDAVLITHSHADHYHVPSLMMLPRDIFIIVPHTNEETILCPNFGRELRTIGFKNIIELDWYSEPLRIENIEISALPFYGEQPLRHHHPRDKKLRNMGNSYFFQTPFFNALCLIDSGFDADGSMLQVAEFVKQRFGKVDAILSNLQEFYVGVGRGNPFYVTGGGHYWLSLTPEQIANFLQMSGDLITLGTDGVAEICRITDARIFLPYSHLWWEIGSSPRFEPAMLRELSMNPAISESRTEIKSWCIGDSWQPK
jgi:L-ascorbate metabolism protein UlaG (beta-lactamase superfamily)